MRWMAKTGAALAGLALVTAVLPASGAERSVLRWDMNEPAGASEMEPSRGDLVGAIGDEVRTGRWVDGAQNYGFPFVTPNKPPARPEHLVMVPEDDRLDPDDEKLRITFRFRSKQNFGNVMQKGQARTAGGYWKFQMPNGRGPDNAQRQLEGAAQRRRVAQGDLCEDPQLRQDDRRRQGHQDASRLHRTHQQQQGHEHRWQAGM
jgi:hypothetical protein